MPAPALDEILTRKRRSVPAITQRLQISAIHKIFTIRYNYEMNSNDDGCWQLPRVILISAWSPGGSGAPSRALIQGDADPEVVAGSALLHSGPPVSWRILVLYGRFEHGAALAVRPELYRGRWPLSGPAVPLHPRSELAAACSFGRLARSPRALSPDPAAPSQMSMLGFAVSPADHHGAALVAWSTHRRSARA